MQKNKVQTDLKLL